MNIKALLFISTLCIAQSNVCMELTKPKTELTIPDDEQEWTILKKEKDVEPFAGKIVKCYFETNNPDHQRCLNQHDFMTCDADNQMHLGIGYSIIVKTIFNKNYPSDYSFNNCAQQNKCNMKILDRWLEKNTIAIRLLKLDEAQAILKSKQFFKRSAHGGPLPNNYFKLCDLLPKEQRHYIHDQLKATTLTLRLIHKLRKEECLLGSLPKDVLNMIITRLIDMQVQSNQNIPLEFEEEST